ncbi:MAG: tRNA uridine-5-carboxymethylaminomethyl(34) synthesis GTPase MnmE [Pseudomonadota bacterium]|nr:tRNA uridine-5-carboxymethylaminomethyl(34) synthesis GTPase MnmE [Pseudomonadota bacterium]
MTHARDREPIFAVATGNSTTAVAIIRISGENILPLLAKIIPKRDQWQARHAYLLKLTDNDSHLDTCLALFFPAPHSYSGQEMLEIHCHGGNYIRHRLCELLQACGIRAAEAGELTKRAFLNGKIDLIHAEGIAQLINADTETQWRAAQQLTSGSLPQQLNTLRNELIKALSLLNAAIDFPDERETQVLQTKAVETAIITASDQIKCMLTSYQQGRIAAHGLRIALVGRPNAGKSSLLNLLLQQPRAIVSTIAGTTRDYLEENFLLDGRLFKLVDTAGLHDTDDHIEQHGIKNTNAVITNCDLVCLLKAVDDPSPALELEATQVLRLTNKIDLATSTQRQRAQRQGLIISCQTGEGIEQFQRHLIKIFDHHIAPLKSQNSTISCERHYLALQRSISALQLALQELRQHNRAECIAFELQVAVRELADIVGNVSNDEVLAEIFGKFCLGK